MEGEDLQFCLLELISDGGAAWPLYRQHRENPWAHSRDPLLEKLQQQRSWDVGLVCVHWNSFDWTVERSQGIAIKSAVEFVLLGRERKPNQGNVLKRVPVFFFSKLAYKQKVTVNEQYSFALLYTNKFLKINLDINFN